MSFSVQMLFSLRLYVCEHFTFSTSCLEPLGRFQLNLAQSFLGQRGFKFVETQRPHSLIKIDTKELYS